MYDDEINSDTSYTYAPVPAANLNTGGADWASWFQNVAGSTIKTITEAEYKAPYDLAKMQLAQFGPYGQPYYEGVPNGGQNGVTATGKVQIPQSWLLLGGVVLLFMMNNK